MLLIYFRNSSRFRASLFSKPKGRFFWFVVGYIYQGKCTPIKHKESQGYFLCSNEIYPIPKQWEKDWQKDRFWQSKRII